MFWSNKLDQARLNSRKRVKALLKSKIIPGIVELAFYLGRVSEEDQVEFRKLLEQRLDLNPVQLYRFFHTPIGEDLLNRFSNLINTEGDSNATYALRETLIKTVAESEGLSVLKFLRKFSTSTDLKINLILFTAKQIGLLLKQTEAMVTQISKLSAAEATLHRLVDFSALPDIRESGECGIDRQIITLKDESRRLRKFRVIVYQPQTPRPGKTPVVVISHGLGSSPEDFREYAQHLASYGYLVALPQHPGSDSTQIQDMLAGDSREVFKLNEFIDRPLDIICVINELERRNQLEYRGRLNLQAVGVMGHSFGGYTALALAGAEIDFEKLEQACEPVVVKPNISLLLQCRALRLPRKTYNFRDERVKAVLPVDSVGSEVFGPKGLSQIKIPVFMIAGSKDKMAPAVLEQIRVFPWLATSNRYLALIKGKAHVGNFSKSETGLKCMLLKTLPHLTGSNATIFYNYAYAMSLAFFEVHISKNIQYLPYLQSSYAKYISQDPFNLYLISASSVDELNQVLQDFRAKLG
ncbi:MAG: alpha/beta hydrolase [Symploca sp. SIO1C4]|uniref:Alpha/beta hydrolase n=1 Tax=Symploca sp. SIO1C4 TaxID=2607765 RepID=A0A6B3NDV8_9CYAN|nr:alpha/beta hydrolase [Symploca sp. SIO1C4]NET04656.1 alpha/beta hydrolase [Symploca sp. SIO2B6]